MTKNPVFLVIPTKASSGGFVPDILPILTVNKTQDARLKTQELRHKNLDKKYVYRLWPDFLAEQFHVVIPSAKSL